MASKDLSPPQAELIENMRAGHTLKETRIGEFLLVAPHNRYTTKVRTGTVKAMLRAGRIRDTGTTDRNGHKLYALEEKS